MQNLYTRNTLSMQTMADNAQRSDEQMDQLNTPRSGRRRLVVLCSLFFAMLVFTFVAQQLKESHNRFESQVEAAGGKYYAHQSQPILRRLVSRLTGGPTTSHVLRFAPGRVSDNWLKKHRSSIDDMEMLNLTVKSPNITDDGIAQLATANRLIGLDASGTQITDHGVSLLTKLPKLSWILVENTKITDASIAHFNLMPQLHALRIAGTEITGSGIQKLALPAGLREISLDSRQLTQQALTASGFKSGLVGFSLQEADAESVSRLTELNLKRSVQIQGPGVTSECMPALEQLIRSSSIRQVMLLDVSLTEDEVNQLKRIRPGACGVHSMSTFDFERMRNASKTLSNDRLW